MGPGKAALVDAPMTKKADDAAGWIERPIVLKYRLAIRTAATLAIEAKKFEAEVELRCDDVKAGVGDLMRVLLIGALKGRTHPKLPKDTPYLLAGTKIVLAARGADAEAALKELPRVFDEPFEPV